MYKKEIIVCDCHSTEHQFVFLYSDEDGHPICYVHTHLNKRPFWERLKYGIKYIFGYRSQYGAFDEFIINPKDVHKLQELVHYLQTGKEIDNWNKLWAKFTETNEYKTSISMNLYLTFFNWLKKNYQSPIEK